MKINVILSRRNNNNKLFKIAFKPFSSVHVDPKDNEFFKKIKDWWDPEGSVRTLHYYNDLRIKYLLRELKKENVIKEEKNIKPFENLDFIDIGCGGGLFCEVYKLLII